MQQVFKLWLDTKQATSHYLSQCWPRSILPYGITSHNELTHCFISFAGHSRNHVDSERPRATFMTSPAPTGPDSVHVSPSGEGSGGSVSPVSGVDVSALYSAQLLQQQLYLSHLYQARLLPPASLSYYAHQSQPTSPPMRRTKSAQSSPTPQLAGAGAETGSVCTRCGRRFVPSMGGPGSSETHCTVCSLLPQERSQTHTRTSQHAKQPPPPPKTYRCVFCRKHFQNRRRLINHLCVQSS